MAKLNSTQVGPLGWKDNKQERHRAEWTRYIGQPQLSTDSLAALQGRTRDRVGAAEWGLLRSVSSRTLSSRRPLRFSNSSISVLAEAAMAAGAGGRARAGHVGQRASCFRKVLRVTGRDGEVPEKGLTKK